MRRHVLERRRGSNCRRRRRRVCEARRRRPEGLRHGPVHVGGPLGTQLLGHAVHVVRRAMQVLFLLPVGALCCRRHGVAVEAAACRWRGCWRGCWRRVNHCPGLQGDAQAQFSALVAVLRNHAQRHVSLRGGQLLAGHLETADERVGHGALRLNLDVEVLVALVLNIELGGVIPDGGCAGSLAYTCLELVVTG